MVNYVEIGKEYTMGRKLAIIFTVASLILGCTIVACTLYPNQQDGTAPFDVTMYCKEMKANGDITDCDPFSLKGKVYSDEDGTPYLHLYPFQLDGISLRGLDDGWIDTSYYLISEDLSNRIYHIPIMPFLDSDSNSFSMDIHLSRNFDYCIIAVNNHYYVGSVEPNFDAEAIMKQFVHASGEYNGIS